MRCPVPGPPGSLCDHAISRTAFAPAAIGVPSRTLAEVERPLRSTASPVGALAALCCAATMARAPDPPSPAGAALDARFTGLPSMVMREMTMPSVTSAGTHGAAWGAFPRK